MCVLEQAALGQHALQGALCKAALAPQAPPLSAGLLDLAIERLLGALECSLECSLGQPPRQQIFNCQFGWLRAAVPNREGVAGWRGPKQGCRLFLEGCSIMQMPLRWGHSPFVVCPGPHTRYPVYTALVHLSSHRSNGKLRP